MAPSSSPDSKCPRCGEALPADAVVGLCPRCLMVGAMEPTQAGDQATAALPPLTPEELAPHFPQLDILECLGRGGMGVVYKARQKSLNRLVALKLLAPERADDPQFAARFEKEAQALAALNHPHIVGVYDFGQAGGFYYLLMEFVDGVNLRQLLQTKRLTPKEALSIVPPVCDALQCAHDAGIVHRDIKPENLLIDKNGVVKIADFGIAKMLGGRDTLRRVLDAEACDSTDGTQPVPTMGLGTPDYAAPEQHDSTATTDHRADIYSLGVVLYEMLTGERPTEKLMAPSKRVQVDIRIDEIVLRALEKSPELRFATAAEFRTQVESVQTGNTVEQTAAPAPVSGFQFKLVEQRDGRRVILWRGVLDTALAVFALILVVGAASSLVSNGAPPLLVVVAFAGIAAFLTVGASVRISLQPGTPPHSEPDDITGLARFSRAAIIGACWVSITLFSFVAAGVATYQIRGGTATSPEWWQFALLIPALILGVAGPFATTILGWVAVSQIRRSAGRIHGLYLALFDGLVFPLMSLSTVIALSGVAMAKMFVDFYANPSVIGHPHVALVTRLANWLSLNKEVAVIVGMVVAIVVNVLIVRAVLRAVRREVASAPPDSSATDNEIKAASVAIILALIAAALGALAAIRNASAWPAMTLSLLFAGMAIIMALPVRRLAVGKSALIVAALGTVIWPLLTLIASHSRADRFQSPPPDAFTNVSSATFGPVIERVITHPGDGTENYFLDLDSGNFVAAPEDVFDLLRNRFDKVTKTGRTDEPIKDWARTSGADLALAFASPDVTLALYGGTVVFPTLSFEAADPLEVADDALQQQKAAGKSMPPLTMFHRHELDRDGAFVFRTHEGGIGLLQIASQSTEQDDVALSVDASGQVAFDNKVTSFEALGEMLKQRLAGNKNLTVFIHCDTKSVPQISLMAVSKFVRNCGVTNLLFTTGGKPRRVKIRYKLLNSEIRETPIRETKVGRYTRTAQDPVKETADSAYVRTGLPVVAMKWPTPPSWGEAKDGLQLGMRVNGNAHIGGEVKVELWVCNSSALDIRFRQCGRNDVGLQVSAKDSSGKERDAEMANSDGLPVFQRIQLPPGHLLKVKEFILRFDVEANTSPQAQTAAFHLSPGDYQLSARWSDSHPLVGNERANETDWSGELTSGEVDVTLSHQPPAADGKAKD